MASSWFAAAVRGRTWPASGGPGSRWWWWTGSPAAYRRPSPMTSLGGRIATEHLLRLGHRRIGFVGDDAPGDPAEILGFVSSARRLTGYRQALTAAGVRYDPALVRRGPHDAAIAGRLAADLLALPDPPSAIFAASDTQALGVLDRRPGGRIAGPRGAFAGRLRRCRGGLAARPQHGPAAAGAHRSRRRAPAVRAAPRGADQATAPAAGPGDGAAVQFRAVLGDGPSRRRTGAADVHHRT